MSGRTGRALAELGAAAPIGAVALLVINDHLLKAAFHNGVTGKLSDVAICFLLPLLISACLGMVCDWRVQRRLWVGAAIGAAVFWSLEMSDLAGDLLARTLAVIAGPLRGDGVVLTRDPTDLLALLCVPIAVAYGRWRARVVAAPPPRSRVLGAAALVTAALALGATSPADRCSEFSPPVAFDVAGDCGPGGVIVVEADKREGELAIHNPAALGLPPLGPRWGQDGGAYGGYRGASCPYTLDQGEWQVTVGSTRRCAAALVDGVLAFTCEAVDGGAGGCRSTLTVRR